jgi:hypothetical protein
MNVRFNHPRKLGSKLYGKGIHPVPDDFKTDWFFMALEANGDVVVLPEEIAAKARPDAHAAKASKKV